MKRIIACVLALALCVTVCCSCVAEKTKNEKILLVASFYPVYIFTLNIVDGIDEITVECMAEQNVGCLHDYQILSKDARLISDSDAFIINGAGMEEFLEDVYMSVDDISVIDSSKNIEVIEACHEEHHEEDEHHHHSVNSHIWMSVKNAIVQCENIADELTVMYPQYKEQIENNKSKYITRLKILDDELELKSQNIKGANIITFHESFDYLANDYSVNILAKVESHEGGEPSAKGLAELTEIIKENKVKVLFVEPDYKGSAATILSNETGVEICVINPVINGELSVTAYEDIMRENMKSILKAVN
ncbi:MAG: zinc ABC transporter substrate-binding protein [Clostridia bacterium]|nr:zinc ABC transporter substrate-binding protein [Clostridia bacterium]